MLGNFLNKSGIIQGMDLCKFLMSICFLECQIMSLQISIYGLKWQYYESNLILTVTGLTQNLLSVVAIALPCNSLSAAMRLAGTILRKPYVIYQA